MNGWRIYSKHGDSSSASFMDCVECISERESRKFEEGLNIKVKLDIFIILCINVLVRA